MAENTKIIISAVDQTGAAIASVNKGLGNLQSAASSLAPLLGGLTGALSVGAFAGFVKGTIDAADAMNDLSQKVGIGIRDLATWKLAAEQSGTSLESVARGIKGLSGYMVEHSAKLRAAGITASDANGAMVQLADLFAAMPDGVQKTTLSVQLFGKAGMDMIPMLNMGSKGLAEAQEKAAAYGKKLAELAPQADEFNDMMSELGLQAQIAGMSITSYFLPGLIGMSHWLNDIAAGGAKAKTALEWMDEKMPLGFGLRWAPTLALAGFDSDPSRRGMAGKIGGRAPGMSLADELALGDRNSAGLAAMGLLGKPAGAAAKAGKPELFGPDLPYYAAAALKEEAAFAARAKAFTDQHEARAEMYRIETEGEEAVREAMEKTTAEAAKESWKASQDAAKKAAEDATKSWENFTRDIESSLTDALMRSFEAGDSFGEAFAKNLQNTFKSMILKAAVQLTVGTVSGAVQQATGVSFSGGGGIGGAGGTAMNLLSAGQSLYGAFTGATASTLGGLVGGSFGAGMQGASLAAGLAGPTTAGAAGAMGAGAMAATAIPYVAAAVAIASILGGLKGHVSRPKEYANTMVGPDASTALNSWKTDGGSQGQAKAGGLSIGDQMRSLAGLIGGSIEQGFVLGTHYTQKYNVMAMSVGDPMAKSDTLKQFQVKMDNQAGMEGLPIIALLVGIQKGLVKTDDYIKKFVGLGEFGSGDATVTAKPMLEAIVWMRSTMEQLKTLPPVFKSIGEAINKGITLETVDTLKARMGSIGTFYDLFYSDAEKFDNTTKQMRAAFGGLNIAMPETRDSFKNLVSGIDTTTDSGLDLFGALIDMAPAMDQYYNALKDELNVKNQLAATMNESSFATAVDYRRYQGVAANYDATLAGDYAYNIRMGAVKPGTAANGDLVGELRALRVEMQAQNLAIATNTQDTAKLLRRWNGDGMPETRVVA